MALSCLNVPVKRNANGFLPQETISITFHGLEVAMHYTLKLVRGAIINSSQNNKPPIVIFVDDNVKARTI